MSVAELLLRALISTLVRKGMIDQADLARMQKSISSVKPVDGNDAAAIAAAYDALTTVMLGNPKDAAGSA
ncbi:hypothetical protein [Tardibacter chloracetimidivorans]|uniref:hypothetical protein n=1 Tax=Tardibacter chloracetimidivorans TaxID=1921510 RepID=UPI001301116C|nr:hypothetical protein [Tardibacter chloracetimidivorans]